MKKNIVIFGSTGSIGSQTLSLIKEKKANYRVRLLSTNTKLKKVLNQAKLFNVKKIIISDFKTFLKAKKKYSNLNIKFYNSFDIINKLFNKKIIDYSMISITGIEGLYPTLNIIKFSKNIAIANKESIICGWNLIKKKLKKYKTNFIPVDSEHYSIHSLMGTHSNADIESIYITASGGPFLNTPISQFHKITKKSALKHPNWKMGKKITIDSATMMNKVFEVIEAKKLFDLKYSKINIITHPNSYLHAIIKFKNALIKILLHQPNMKIPIFNSLHSNDVKYLKSNKINFNTLNKLNLKKVDIKKFPLVKLLLKLPQKDSLYETVLVTINDFFVNKFLENKISYLNMIKLIKKNSKKKIFLKYRFITPKKIDDIINLHNYVSLKLK
jgi:1-deoxy-D-xylulose-5-phosphate reductoisomerase